MFVKGYTNIRALIESQYGILSQMIYDIDNHYQTNLQQINSDVRHIAEKNAEGDYDEYISIVHNFEDAMDRQTALCVEARKILFCSIFSYYEKMLHGIIDYYDIKSRAKHSWQLYKAIQKEYKKRYAATIDINKECVDRVNNTYRWLRYYFIHGKLPQYYDEEQNLVLHELYGRINILDDIEWLGNLDIDITDNTFLYNALNDIKLVLTSIEDAFSNKAQDEWKAYKEATEYFSEAIKLYPPEYPGAEDDYPPYCSIAVHKYLEKAEQICLYLVSPQRKDAKTMLSSIRQLKKQMKNLGFRWYSKLHS